MSDDRTVMFEDRALESAATLVDEVLYFSRLRVPRSGAPCGARLQASTPGGRLTVVVAHLDVDGAELAVGVPVSPRTRIDLPLPLPGVVGPLEGRVVSCERVDDAAWQVGMKFVGIDAARRRALALVVKALRRMAPRH